MAQTATIVAAAASAAAALAAIAAISLWSYHHQQATRHVVRRLRPGQEIKSELQRLLAEEGGSSGGGAAIVACVGSIATAKIRLANAVAGMPLADCLLEIRDEPMEIVCMSGTLTRDGLHVHIALADGRTGQVVGGHLVEAVVHTTCELVLVVNLRTSPHNELRRVYDKETGFNELQA